MKKKQFYYTELRVLELRWYLNVTANPAGAPPMFEDLLESGAVVECVHVSGVPVGREVNAPDPQLGNVLHAEVLNFSHFHRFLDLKLIPFHQNIL